MLSDTFITGPPVFQRMRLFHLIFFLLPLLLPAAGINHLDIDHAYVVAQARELMKQPHDPARGEVAKSVRSLSYDDYRRIRFRPEQSLWQDGDLPFRVQFYHPGSLHDRTVALHEFSSGYAQAIPFNKERFDYQDLKFPFWAKWGLGYAGFRILHELNEPDKWDEVISFLGASYFRALAPGQAYGLSARGLALNSGGPGAEEFPRFVAFWLGKPEAGSPLVTVHGLLDSPSVAGAYTFVVQPGAATVVEVKATLFFRAAVPTLGLAPMTSMFWFGEGSAHRFGDFRPEVHDSDGLLVATDAGTRIWRPLRNPAALQLTDFPAASLTGFGLLQRDRDFSSYEDIEARYEKRPGLWVEPVGSWPAGRVRLVELPAGDEYQDNMVAFWMPDQPVAPGAAPLELAWRLHWTNAPVFGGPPGYVRATRQTVQDGAPGQTHFIIDYAAASLAAFGPGQAPQAEVEVPDTVKITEQQVIRNPVDGSWRLSLRLAAAPGGAPVEIRARLLVAGEPVSETWSMPWEP